jgi:dTDP-glucose 4,6-dehydratase
MRIVITGGCGFIGSSFAHLCIIKNHDVLIIDKLTYAGNIENAPMKADILVKDICDVTAEDLGEYDYLVNFAAESHVDNSIKDGKPFVRTNIEGTFNLLELARKNDKLKKFIQISTDEVYGDLEDLSWEVTKSTTKDKLNPSSYYSATKASADLLVESCGRTYGLPYAITRTCNNFGFRQYDEKFIPTIIYSIREDKSIPIYGDGLQKREWIWVEDNVNAIMDIIEFDENSYKTHYHIGSGDVLTNMDIINMVGTILNKTPRYEFVTDRLGHDRMYSLQSNNRITKTLFEYLKETIYDSRL